MSDSNLGLLGCGEYRVFVYERGGDVIVEELPWQDVFYGAVLDDTSNATVNVPIAGSRASESCCAALNEIEPWAHEVHIFRDGRVAWIGPITDMRFDGEGGLAIITCRDLFYWFERRIFTRDFDFSGDMARIFNQMAVVGLEEDGSPNITVQATDTGIEARRTILGSERRRVADEMRELARTGLDFTAKGRTILCGGVEIPTTKTLRVWGPSLRTASLEMRGTDATTHVSMTGLLPGVNTESELIEEAQETFSRYGLLQTHFSELAIYDEVSLRAAAANRLAFLRRPPRYLIVSFDPNAPFSMDELIPGSRCDVRAEIGCIEVVEEMRLQSLGVSVNATNEGGISESVNGTIIPLGATEDTGA